MNPFFIISFISSFIAAFCSISIFFSIDQVFQSTILLAIGLSIRTLSTALFSYRANILIKRLGTYLSYLLSQLIAITTVLVLWLGFLYKNKFIVIFGVALMGIPLTLTTIFLTITFRLNHKTDENFRNSSGLRELIFGIGRLSACITAPIFLSKFNLNSVFIVFCVGCIINLLLSPLLNFDNKDTLSPNMAVLFNYHALKNPATWEYAIKLIPSYILVAFVALVASSNELDFTKHITMYHHQMLWSLEAFMMVIGGFVYVHFRKIGCRYIEPLLILNSILLYLLLWKTNFFMLSIIIMLTSFFICFSYNQFRDDYIVSAGTNKQLIEIYSGFSIFFRDLICTASPVFLSALFLHFSLFEAVSILLCFQSIFYLLMITTRIHTRVKTLPTKMEIANATTS